MSVEPASGHESVRETCQRRQKKPTPQLPSMRTVLTVSAPEIPNGRPQAYETCSRTRFRTSREAVGFRLAGEEARRGPAHLAVRARGQLRDHEAAAVAGVAERALLPQDREAEALATVCTHLSILNTVDVLTDAYVITRFPCKTGQAWPGWQPNIAA